MTNMTQGLFIYWSSSARHCLTGIGHTCSLNQTSGSHFIFYSSPHEKQVVKQLGLIEFSGAFWVQLFIFVEIF